MNLDCVIFTKDCIDDPDTIRIWRNLQLKSENALKMQQSPEWYPSLRYNRKKENCSIAIVRTDKGQIKGIVPYVVGVGCKKLKFHHYCPVKVG